MLGRILCSCFLLSFFAVVSPAEEIVLFEPGKSEPKILDADAATRQGILEVSCRPDTETSGISCRGKWTIPDDLEIAVEWINLEDRPLKVRCRLDSYIPDTEGMRSLTFGTILRPGERKIQYCPLPRAVPAQLYDKLVGMHRYPGNVPAVKDSGRPREDKVYVRSNLSAITLSVADEKQIRRFGVVRIVAVKSENLVASYNEALHLSADRFFPMFDRFGQYKHAEWPGKTHSIEDLKKNAEAEASDLREHESPPDRNRYGGWSKGPRLDATGHFRTEKIDGAWWLVDPEGRLFWSQGCNCVRPDAGITGITGRENLFEELPGGRFETDSTAIRNFYKGKGGIKAFDFVLSNLELKYGERGRDVFAENAHRRLRSWGFNTIAAWSDPRLCSQAKTPYTTLVTGGRGVPVLRASSGFWRQFYDPFDPRFREAYARRFEEIKGLDADPWCLGVFTDNELSWGNDTSLAVAALCSPADQPAKKVLVEHLKKHYSGDVRKLNAVWGTSHADWLALLDSTERPDDAKALVDLKALYKIIVEEYFKIVSEEFRKKLPNKLLLGSRFAAAWSNDSVTIIASRYCDVITRHEYRDDVESIDLPTGVDKPVLIGEYQFGTLDRGSFFAGLRYVENQDERANAVRRYVRSGLKHPNIVGCHWFRFHDHATSGRTLDGENGQYGLVDICDTPYPEMIDAFRELGKELYPLRMSENRIRRSSTGSL